MRLAGLERSLARPQLCTSIQPLYRRWRSARLSSVAVGVRWFYSHSLSGSSWSPSHAGLTDRPTHRRRLKDAASWISYCCWSDDRRRPIAIAICPVACWPVYTPCCRRNLLLGATSPHPTSTIISSSTKKPSSIQDRGQARRVTALSWHSSAPTRTRTPTRTSSPTSAPGSSTSRTRTRILADLSDTRRDFPHEDHREDVR